MMLKTVWQKDLERIKTMTIIEAVAYANRLNIRLRRNSCTDEERKNGLKLFERLNERVHFLNITLEPAFSYAR
jgi:hypothetical protein